ncbi:hypothetical protein RHGRI_024271 [Rhododendron griersonianum]|uniref:PGG domain-containing protein n=1 Tax=Rhododendron griersonianum TaxID=479676 RepID=A0AAV6J7T9_9ERIC|nr:hypothetical protein RHGRI_024271 [Rhododendron griersonianum]
MVKLLVKESFVDINANNSETEIALDIALLLDQSDEARSIVNTLRYAGALESSSSANNDYSLAKFFNSPEQPLERLKAAAETGDINGLYGSIKEAPDVLDRIDAIPFVDTPLHTAALAGHTDFAVEILRLKPSFGRKLNPDGLSSLHLALINHKFDTVKRLIKLDKELIRVKGKQGETPLHFIAKKEDINADQQQRVLDDHRVNADQQQKELDDHHINTLADFLFACPNSIEDLTNQDETVLHIAVRTKNKSAVEIILGLIRRINKRKLLANKDDKGNTASDLAVESSQLELQRRPSQVYLAPLEGYAVVTSTSLQMAVISTPRTVTFTNDLFDANTGFFNATLSIPTDNAANRLLFDSKDHLKYGMAFDNFYGLNTVVFVLSAATIMFVLPFISILILLHGALLVMMMGYGTSFYLISPSFGYCEMYVIASALCASLVYICRYTTFAIEEIAKGNTRDPFFKWLSKLQGSQRLMMLDNLINKRRLLANKDDKGNTDLDLAVENSQLEMVKLLVKEPLANVYAKNSDKQTALDIALQRLAYVARSAKALENSSYQSSVTMELRNTGLVVAVLIATVTFTRVISPPGGIRGGDFNLFTDGGNFNATVTSTNNLFAANTSFFNATLSIPTDNPVKRLLFDAKDLEYGTAFFIFYGFNTVAFVLSAAMIMFVLPASQIELQE